MYARKRLDVGWKDLLSGLLACAGSFDEKAPRARIERAFSPAGAGASEALATLSVRSGLDLYLEELALPRGSEVLMSALTIPDMWKIVEHHGLVPVPVDLDPRTLAPRMASIEAAASPRTRAAIVAHLFGLRLDLEPIARLARSRRWLLLEDCAQSWTGDAERGDRHADVSMFSFGPIKTAAALAGGVLVLRDPEVLGRMRARQEGWPLQERGKYLTRTFKYAGLVGLTKRPTYAALAKGCELAGKDLDQLIQGSVRGFAGGDFFEKIRHRPSPALLSTLARRIERSNAWRVDGRVARARRLLRQLPAGVAVPGSQNPSHSYWVFTVLVDEPDRVVRDLRAAGFDATRAASLRTVPAPSGRPDLEPREAQRILARTVYLPCYPEMPESAIDEMAEALAHAVGSGRKERRGEVVLTPAPASPGSSQRSRR